MSDQAPTARPTPPGLFVTLDKLQYAFNPAQAPSDRPHLFTYHLTIHNHADREVTILARKWIIHYANGEIDVIEGDKVIGKTPRLKPGMAFSYASFHLTGSSAVARGAFHGVDDDGSPLSVPIPEFSMNVPGDPACN